MGCLMIVWDVTGLPYGARRMARVTGASVGLVAVATGVLLAVMPRSWPGKDPNDPFSWIGMSSAKSAVPYSDLLRQLTLREMQPTLVDTVETCSLIIDRKYRLFSASILTIMPATAMQVASWFVV